jgi:hypothetical protein
MVFVAEPTQVCEPVVPFMQVTVPALFELDETMRRLAEAE